MENPIKMDDLGVPLFSETSICLFPLEAPLASANSPRLIKVIRMNGDRVASPSEEDMFLPIGSMYGVYIHLQLAKIYRNCR